MKEKLARLNTVGDYKISFIAFLFVLLFAPPVIPQINTALFACAAAVVLLLTRYRGALLDAFRRSGAGRFALLFLLFLAYVAVITALNVFVFRERVQTMHYITQWYRFFLLFPCLTAAGLYICLRAKELRYTPEKLALCFAWATAAQFVLAMAALLIPQLKEAFVNVIYRATGAQYLAVEWVMRRRGFGFSNSFVDSFGWGMGVIAALPFFAVSKKSFRPVLLVPFVLFVSIVNVRTGLIMAALGGLVSAPYLLKSFFAADKKTKKRIVGAVVAALLILCILIAVVFAANKITLRWIAGDVLSFIDAMDTGEDVDPGEEETTKEPLSDSDTTTAEVLFSDRFWNLPPARIFLFGSGHSIFGAEGYPNSDVGYVNDLWLGGVVGCVLLYASLGVLMLSAWRRSRALHRKLLTVFLALSFAVFQIKANAVMFCAGMNVMLPLLFYLNYYGSFPSGIEVRRDPAPLQTEDKVSVVVPVYKTEAYLERCVRSLLAQSYKNLEIILVDDGSPDGSGALCDRFAEEDPRVKVLHTENGGLSAARNRGLDAATGAYVAFVDSDDFVHPDYVAALCAAAKENDAQIAACGYVLYYNSLVRFDMTAGEARVYTPEEALRDIFTMENRVHVVAWNKLYSRSLFTGTGIRYPEGMLHEDTATTYRLCAAADKVAYTPLPLYYYVQRKGSIMGKSFSDRRLDLLKANEGVGEFLRAGNLALKEEYEYYTFLNRQTILNAICDSGAKRPDIFVPVSEEIFRSEAALAKNRYYGRKNALTVRLLHGGEKRYRIVRRVWARLDKLRKLV